MEEGDVGQTGGAQARVCDQARVCAVLPAAGAGERAGTSPPKQLHLVLGRPLLSYTLHHFDSCSQVQDVVVVVAPDQQESVTSLLRHHGHVKFRTAAGSHSRHRSILAGLQQLLHDEPEVVIIHDAVRPFLDQDTLLSLVSAARAHGAAGMVRPLVSTVLKPDDQGFLEGSLVRAQYLASETPQAFRFDVIYSAYQKATPDELDHGTECLELCRRHCGVKAKLLPGPSHLWKVTQPHDLALAEMIVRETTRVELSVVEECSSTCGLAQDLIAHLHTLQPAVTTRPALQALPPHLLVCASVSTLPDLPSWLAALPNTVPNPTVIILSRAGMAHSSFTHLQETVWRCCDALGSRVCVVGVCLGPRFRELAKGVAAAAKAVAGLVRRPGGELSGQCLVF